jgi:tetratricopeptide (TPR) repeat protein
LDQKNNVEENIEKLKKIVDENPNDILLRWLLAIECRHNRIHELGAEQFSIIVKSWEPGPAVVHQSYANILIDLKQYEKALEHRYRTVELEPKRWSYTSLGNTLTYLKRYDEADSAYKKSISIADDANSWSGWAWSLYKRKAYDDAIVKAKEALRRDNGDYEAIIYWANSLEGKHYYLESLHLKRFGLALHPDNSSLVDNAIRVERKLNQIESIRDKK